MSRAARFRAGALALTAAAFASSSFGYYHYLHFPVRNGNGIPEKFDLNNLRNKTLPFFIIDQSNIQFSGNDSFPALVSEIRLAARSWNDVETSDLRLAFGGILPAGSNSASPALEIIFGEIPPGLVALGGPKISSASRGSFVPIVRSIVLVKADSTRSPSYSETFFTSIVHEMGHALGLQHTFTSSAMATSKTRATTKARPLAADDVAGLSLLYPRPNFFATTGSISGRVTANGAGVALASVVAISPNGTAISTLTNPDGTYRIDGIPPRRYTVYAHPLPPAISGQTSPGDIAYPVDGSDNMIGPGPTFDTTFYGGVVDVSAAAVVNAINFAVRPRSSVALHTVSTFAFPGGFGVQPAFLSPSQTYPFVVAAGYGLVSGSGPAPGLAVSTIGGATLNVHSYANAPAGYVQIDMDVRSFSFAGDSPRHLLFASNNDFYVLPSAFQITEKAPPAINSIIPALDGGLRVAVLAGTNLSSTTRILFDGMPGVVKAVDEGTGRLTVIPPQGPPGYSANVVALNQDGQSSLFVQDTPPSYTYIAESAQGSFSISPAALPAGVESLIQVDAVNANFQEGQTCIGFGSSDIAIRQVWVVSPTRLLVNVVLNPTASTGATNVTLMSGLNLTTQPASFNILSYNSRATWLNPAVVRASNGQPSLSPGSNAVVTIANSPGTPTVTPTVFVNERAAPVMGVQGNQVFFQIPAGTPIGPAALRVELGSERSLPIAVAIGPAPPLIVSASAGANTLVDTGHPAKGGDVLAVMVLSLEQPGAAIDLVRLSASVAGFDAKVSGVAEQTGAFRVMVSLPASVPAGTQPLILSIDGRPSDPFPLFIGN